MTDHIQDYYVRLRATASAFAEFRSAKDVAKELNTTNVSIYAHLERLKRLGYTVETDKQRQGKRGPMATVYKVTAPAMPTGA